jgi:hypothetical protein
VLAANTAMGSKLRIIHEGVVQREVAVTMDGDHEQRVTVDMAMRSAGRSQWTAELIPDQDHYPINNQATCTVAVHGRIRILVLHQEPDKMRPLVRALRQQEIEADVRGKHGMPETLDGLLAQQLRPRRLLQDADRGSVAAHVAL